MVTMLAVASCGRSDDTGNLCVHDPPLTYDNYGRAYLDQYCNGCHSSLLPEDHRRNAPMGADFDTYEGVLTWGERLVIRGTGEEPTMPPGGGPSPDEVSVFKEWLECEVATDAALLAEQRAGGDR
jgi:hypothetical protein